MGNDSYPRFHRAEFIVHIVVFTGGIIRKGRFVDQTIKKADKIFAADSGANCALSWGIIPEIIIGDLDSIDENILRLVQNDKKVKIIQSPKEKNETDTELAIHEAIKQHATEITLIGGIEGDRLDHILANIFLLSGYNIPIRFVNGDTQCWRAKGPWTTEISGQKNDIISLIPLQFDVTSITTSGLQYQLTNETLSFGKARGISNVMLGKNATITFEKGALLIVQHKIKRKE